jgi:predicted alpha/beta-hydrolase family hydrolase
MTDPLLVDLAKALHARRHGVARFNFAYRDEGRKLPDRAPKLEATYREVIERVRSDVPHRKLVIGGKSMGGRMASHLAAQGDPLDGLLLLGYPLHPPKQPEKLRDAHLKDIRVPTLFVQGTRDPLCDLALLKPRVKKMGKVATLLVIGDADHSLVVPKRSGRDRKSVIAEVVAAIEAAFVG